jgi:hypothetical protein
VNETFANRPKRSGDRIVRDHVIEVSLKQVAAPPTTAPTTTVVNNNDPQKTYVVAFMDVSIRKTFAFWFLYYLKAKHYATKILLRRTICILLSHFVPR